ncbi:hypothetical protein LSAC_01195 [Levilinea saccharolytica]|nr:hypothetical protein LSAC_01195 [Levilinea saccharolytica]
MVAKSMKENPMTHPKEYAFEDEIAKKGIGDDPVSCVRAHDEGRCNF